MSNTTILSFCNFGVITLSFASIIVVCTEPLIRVANKFNFFLFTENNFFEYTPSALHRHSQNLFIASAVFLGISMITSLIDLLASLADKEDDTHVVKSTTIVTTGLATVLYISAVTTLGKVIYDVIDKIENLPLPIPIKDVDIIYKMGFSFGTIGLISSLIALVLSGLILHSVSRRRYVELP